MTDGKVCRKQMKSVHMKGVYFCDHPLGSSVAYQQYHVWHLCMRETILGWRKPNAPELKQIRIWPRVFNWCGQETQWHRAKWSYQTRNWYSIPRMHRVTAGFMRKINAVITDSSAQTSNWLSLTKAFLVLAAYGQYVPSSLLIKYQDRMASRNLFSEIY